MNHVLKKSAVVLAMGAALSLSAGAIAKDRIGVTIYKYDDNFMSIFRKDLEAIADKANQFELLMNDSQNNQSTQNDQIDTMIAKGVKTLAINLVDPAAGPTVIKKAEEEDLPVVFFNKDPGQAAIDSYDKAFFVGTNPKQSGVIQGDLIAKAWKAHPEWDLNKDGVIDFVLLKGEPGHPDAEARTKWVVEELHQNGIKTNELFLSSADWDTAKAKDVTTAWLSGPKAKQIEMIISNNDAMAMGAYQATLAQGYKLPIFGVDALPEALQMIKKGELAGTVLNDAENQAKAVYALSANLAEGKDATAGTDYKLEQRYLRIPYVGVDQSNLDKFLK